MLLGLFDRLPEQRNNLSKESFYDMAISHQPSILKSTLCFGCDQRIMHGMALTVSILLLLAVIFFVLRFVRSRFGTVSDLPDSDLPDSDLLDNRAYDPNPGRQESVLDDLWCYPLFSTERRIQRMVVAGVLGSIVLTVLEWRVKSPAF